MKTNLIMIRVKCTWSCFVFIRSRITLFIITNEDTEKRTPLEITIPRRQNVKFLLECIAPVYVSIFLRNMNEFINKYT